MKTAAPVERALRSEVMPLDTQAEPIEVSVKLTPAGGDLFPGAVLGMRNLIRDHGV